ncbi:TonB-dependent receptor plug domain-containing protein [Marispirochaeta sp.]|uniref:TonB-dependent receptor plug domain-containing protein n=1 Tax=Marispirochaeta sp. TaxID=2038653 RepID=UPI0029C8D422|nr:TonB-dependent receptor plug domain-containing protein [Marispirochaeta sp.]
MKKNRLIAACLFLVTISLYGRDIRIIVNDRDLEIPLEGAMIHIVGEEESVYTDMTGNAVASVPEDMERVVLLVSYPGYEGVRLPVSKGTEEIEVAMVLSGFIEGEELVVERSAPGESDEEVGVSIAMDREDMNSTANIGIVEDVMSSIKTLPGVGYTGGWDAQPSIRGGYPEEMAAALDGFYVTYPFHWGGAYSIFNPNMVETAKLSHGIYSARYGRAMSGLLEITTKTPDEPEMRVDGSFSTTSADLFIRSPLGESSGLFLGGKVTYLDTAKLIYPDELEDMTTIPYIRDFYGKWYYKPTTAMEFYLNGFMGTDGVGVDTSAKHDGFTTDVFFDYDYINSFLSGGMKWSPTDTLFIDMLAGYNWNIMNMEYEVSNRGSREYSQNFIDQYSSYLTGDSYSIDGLTNEGSYDLDMRQAQVKLTGEKLLSDSHVLVLGTEEVLKQTSSDTDFTGWTSSFNGSSFELEKKSFTNKVDDNNSINSALFLIWEYGDDQSRISSEVGLRGEHYFIWHDGFNMHAKPAVNPRASVTWTAFEDRYGINALNLSCGTGLFSYFPLSSEVFEKKEGVDDWKFSPDQALFNLVGAEVLWGNGWKFTAESYYKYYLNRLIITTEDDASGDAILYYNTKGKGHVIGFDVMLQKKTGRKWDGYLTYSFIYARYYNPSNTGSEEEADDYYQSNGDPLDEWYYPSFHRFHNLNLVVNWRFNPGWTFSVMGSLATGAPRSQVGDITMYPADFNGTIIEQYARRSFYSDSLRDGISAPIDLRLSYGHYKPGSKVYWEWYIALEDILAGLYEPETNTSFNSYTGEEDKDTSADFNLGVPIPSFGIKVSY